MKKFYAVDRLTRILTIFSAAIVPALSATIAIPDGKLTSISQAMVSAKAGDTVVVSAGIYREQVMIKANITLKARTAFKSIIDGNGKGVAVTLGGGATILGFEIRHGAVGIRSQSSENSVIQCRITGMRESGIICVGRLPRMEDNIIVFNKGSGIQGWDLQGPADSINHNTIAFNGNNGIALEGKSSVAVENNIIAFNERSGLKVSESSANVQAGKNDFFENTTMSYIKLNENFAFDPKFAGPRKMDFALQPDSPCKNKGFDGEDLGARIK
jgi:hypothetical protein